MDKYGNNQDNLRIPWDRREMVVLVSEYFRTKPLGSDKNRKSIKFVSEFLRRKAESRGLVISNTFRNENGIFKQMACVAHYDPSEIESQHVNLTNGSELLRSVTEEYLSDPNKIMREAYESIVEYLCE